MLQFGTFSFYFSFETKIFNSLSDFSANIFLRISCLQTIYFVFSKTCNLFPPYFSSPPPSRKIMVRHLLTMNRSIWLKVFPFGDLQLDQFVDVSVGEPQRPTTHFQLFLRQNSTRPSPLSLMVPRPCWPIASSLPAGVVTLNFSIRIRGNE